MTGSAFQCDERFDAEHLMGGGLEEGGVAVGECSTQADSQMSVFDASEKVLEITCKTVSQNSRKRNFKIDAK